MTMTISQATQSISPRLRVSLILALLSAAALTLGPLADTSAAKPKCGGRVADIVRGSGNDRVKNPPAPNVIYLGAGDDVLVTPKSSKGPDIVCGGDGADRISPGSGDDRVFAGAGDDYVNGDKGNDRIEGGSGNDRARGGKGGDNFSGGAGDDEFFGELGGDRFAGGEGDDLATGDRGVDVFRGGPDDDELLGERDGDELFGDGGSDYLDTGLGDDEADGGDGGADIVIGGLGIDKLRGGPGNEDVVRGDVGNDLMDGGAGTRDIASFTGATPGRTGTLQPGVQVDLAAGVASGEGTRDRLAGIEDVIGSSFADEIIGSSGPNRLDAGPGNDVVDGGPPTGGSDPDEIFGGSGADECSNAGVVVSCGEDPAAVLDVPVVDMWVHIDGERTLSYLDDSGSHSVTISWAGGAYRITSPDADLSPEGSCSDSPTAEGALVVCTAPDRISKILASGSSGNDSIVIDGGVPSDVPTKIDGGSGSDVLRGGPGPDLIEAGESGADRLFGEGGSDGLVAKDGPAELHGGTGSDLLVTFNACAGQLFDGGPQEDNGSFSADVEPGHNVVATVGGRATDPDRGKCKGTRLLATVESLEGTPGADTLIGDSRANRLMGQGGPDTLLGMGGGDLLLAVDGQRDKRLDCGPGALDEVRRDSKDPPAKSC